MAKRKIVKPKYRVPALAKPGDPYVTLEGQQVSPEPLPGEEESPEPEGFNHKTFKPQKRRTVKELPADVGTINGVACVFMYTVLGVGDREIANALNILPHQLQQIRLHAAYKECFSTVQAEFISANSGLLQARLAAASGGALDQVIHLSTKAKKEETRLKASDSILDRAGITAKNDQARPGQLNELFITINSGEKEPVKISVGAGASDAEVA